MVTFYGHKEAQKSQKKGVAASMIAPAPGTFPLSAPRFRSEHLVLLSSPIAASCDDFYRCPSVFIRGSFIFLGLRLRSYRLSVLLVAMTP
jgi:hypothetical protein